MPGQVDTQFAHCHAHHARVGYFPIKTHAKIPLYMYCNFPEDITVQCTYIKSTIPVSTYLHTYSMCL